MSDIQNVTDAISQAAPPAADVPAESQAEKDYRALYEQEKNERIKERNLYRPVQQMFRDLDEGTIGALRTLADMARAGDADGIVDWSLATVQNVTGQSDLAAVIAARQQGPQQQPLGQPEPQQQQQVPQFSPEQLREMVQQEAAAQVRVQGIVAQITSEMQQAGYDPYDAAGQTIIQYARTNGLEVKEAIQWFEGEVAARALAKAQQVAQATQQTPQPAPDGTPAGSAPNKELTPHEAAVARIRSWNAQ